MPAAKKKTLDPPGQVLPGLEGDDLQPEMATTAPPPATQVQAPAPQAAADPQPRHPGVKWLDYSDCMDMPTERFFVDAGHTMDEEAQAVCRVCPVRPECTIHGYLGAPGATLPSGGYFGALSLGQRKKIPLTVALSEVLRDQKALGIKRPDGLPDIEMPSTAA